MNLCCHLFSRARRLGWASGEPHARNRRARTSPSRQRPGRSSCPVSRPSRCFSSSVDLASTDEPRAHGVPASFRPPRTRHTTPTDTTRDLHRIVAMTAMTAVTETRPGHSSHSTNATYRQQRGHRSQEEPARMKSRSARAPAAGAVVGAGQRCWCARSVLW